MEVNSHWKGKEEGRHRLQREKKRNLCIDERGECYAIVNVERSEGLSKRI